jgi:hypothetical protein
MHGCGVKKAASKQAGLRKVTQLNVIRLVCTTLTREMISYCIACSLTVNYRAMPQNSAYA